MAEDQQFQHASLQEDDSARRKLLPPGLLLYVVVWLLAVASFAGTVRYPFVYDDLYIIEQNELLNPQAGWGDVLTAPYWPAEHSLDPLYRPLTMLSFKLNTALTGTDAQAMRATNLVLHGLVSVAVAYLARRLWGRRSAAWVAGMLFAVHPLHAAALGLVVGRAELLTAGAVALLLIRHLGRDTAGQPPSVVYHLTTSLLFLAAALSKEHGLAAWPMIALLDVWQWRQSADRPPWRQYLSRALASHQLGLILAAALCFAVRYSIFGHRAFLAEEFVSPLANPVAGLTGLSRWSTCPALLTLMLRQWFLADPLSPLWSIGGWDIPTSPWRWDVLVGTAVLVMLLVGLVQMWRRGNRVGLLGGLFLLAVLLPCHFVSAANWLYAERWAYLPSVILAVICAGLTVHTPKLSRIAALIVSALLFMTTIAYQQCWQGHEHFFRSTLERQPFNYQALAGLLSLRDRGEGLADSQEYVERLVESFPDTETAWRFELLLRAELKQWNAARRAFDHWSKLRPPTPLPERFKLIDEQIKNNTQ